MSRENPFSVCSNGWVWETHHVKSLSNIIVMDTVCTYTNSIKDAKPSEKQQCDVSLKASYPVLCMAKQWNKRRRGCLSRTKLWLLWPSFAVPSVGPGPTPFSSVCCILTGCSIPVLFVWDSDYRRTTTNHGFDGRCYVTRCISTPIFITGFRFCIGC